MTATADEVLAFWLDEVGPEGWYAVDPALDERIRDRFLATWERARAGALDAWAANPRGALGFVVLTDQFPRNMFRGEGLAFATDARALAAAKAAIARGFDRRIETPARQFFYLPLMHSEVVSDQARAVRLFLAEFGPGESLLHARAHRDVIRRFGRFPYRNAALGRSTTPEEAAWLEAGGYALAVAEAKADAIPPA